MLLDDEPVTDVAADVGILDAHAIALQALDHRQQTVDAVFGVRVLSDAGVGSEQVAHAIELLRREVLEQLRSTCLEFHTRTVFESATMTRNLLR